MKSQALLGQTAYNKCRSDLCEASQMSVAVVSLSLAAVCSCAAESIASVDFSPSECSVSLRSPKCRSCGYCTAADREHRNLPHMTQLAKMSLCDGSSISLAESIDFGEGFSEEEPRDCTCTKYFRKEWPQRTCSHTCSEKSAHHALSYSEHHPQEFV